MNTSGVPRGISLVLVLARIITHIAASHMAKRPAASVIRGNKSSSTD